MIQVGIGILSMLVSVDARQNFSPLGKRLDLFKPDFFLDVLYYRDKWIRL